MRFRNSFPIVSLLLFLCISCTANKALFEGNGTEWMEGGDAKWQWAADEIVGVSEGGAGFVMTKASYKDFVLTLEFYPDETVNSGIFVRCKAYDISNTDCYELNIWDLNPDQTYRTGGVVTRATPLARVETLNKWNTYKIKNKNNQLQVWVNGVLTADISDNDLSEGYIGLQAAETGTIKFKNVKLKVL